MFFCIEGNHLGNVLVTVSDRKLAYDVYSYTYNASPTQQYDKRTNENHYRYNTASTGNYIQASGSDGFVDFYKPDVLTSSDYFCYGAALGDRTFSAANYRYGFNGKENDEESGLQDYGMRIYNPALAKFLSVDPLTKDYPSWSPYPFAMNRPIEGVDLDGEEFRQSITRKFASGPAWTKMPLCSLDRPAPPAFQISSLAYRQRDVMDAWNNQPKFTAGVNDATQKALDRAKYVYDSKHGTGDFFSWTTYNYYCDNLNPFSMIYDFGCWLDHGTDKYGEQINGWEAFGALGNGVASLFLPGATAESKSVSMAGTSLIDGAGSGYIPCVLGEEAKALAERQATNSLWSAGNKEGAIMLDRTVGYSGQNIATAQSYISGYKNLPGNNFTNFVMHGEDFRKMSFWQINKTLNESGITGNLRLWICEGSANSRAMELLAKRRGAFIYASPFKIGVHRHGYFFKDAPPNTSFELFSPFKK